MKKKTCVSSPVAFYGEMTMVDARRAVSVIFCEIMGHLTISHNVLIDKFLKYGSDKWTVTWAENWLNYWAQSVVVSSVKSSWRPGTNSVTQGSIFCPTLFNILVCDLEDWTELHSASSQVIQNSEEWLIHQRMVLSFRNMLAGWRKELTRTLQSSTKAKCQVLHLGWNNLLHQYMLGSTGSGKHLGRDGCGVAGGQVEQEPAVCSHGREGPTAPRAALGKASPQGGGK